MTVKDEKGGIITSLSAFHLEADRCPQGIKMFISGVVGIAEYSDICVFLKTHACRVKISGKKLKLCVFENNTAEIIGKIEAMEYMYGKN